MGVYYGYRPRTFYVPPADIVTSGLVGHWDAAQSASYSGSGTSWTDLSGNNNTATLVNSPTFNAEGSFTLNGSNQYIDMAPNYPNNNFPRFTAAVSISIWFKTGSSATNLSLFGIGNNFTNGARMNMFVSPGQTLIAETAGDAIGTTFGTFSLNTWYNCVVTNAGNITTSQLKVYINGFDVTAAYGGSNNYSVNLAPAGTSQCCLVGTLPGFAGLYNFPGTIAIPMVYNRALTASEVLQNFNARRTRFGV